MAYDDFSCMPPRAKARARAACLLRFGNRKMSYKEIGEFLGVTAARARQIVLIGLLRMAPTEAFETTMTTPPCKHEVTFKVYPGWRNSYGLRLVQDARKCVICKKQWAVESKQVKSREAS